jgi:hypothetical protein
MGVNCDGIIFFGWHFPREFLQEHVEEVRKLDDCYRSTVSVMLKDGKKLDVDIRAHFTEEGYNELIFGRILAEGETYRYVEYTPIPQLDPEVAALISRFFEERQLDKKPGLYLTGSGYS